MTETTPVHTIHPEINAEDALTGLIRSGVREILATALEAEIEEHIDRFRGIVDEQGKRRVIGNGYLPERELQTGAGKIPIKQPRARVRDEGETEEHLKFQSKLCLLYTSPSPRDLSTSRMPSSA